MPKGRYPVEYFSNPDIRKPVEEIYADIQGYTGEFFEEETHLHKSIDFLIPFPPLKYDGKIIKGLFLSQGTEYLYKLFPGLNEIFFSMGYSMWSSYPWSTSADAYLTCYKNPGMEEWFKKNNADRANKVLIPLQDADFTNEYYLAPTFNTPKDIDILCISRLANLKNLPLVARALRIYREKYKEKIKMTLVVGKDFDINLKGLTPNEIEQMRLIEEELTHPSDYINFIPQVPYAQLPKYMTRAKIVLLGSIFEGKNRIIQEAMSCNTPVVVFKDFNKYSRGAHPIMPDEAGLLIPEFSAEAMADTIYEALHNLEKFKPRRKYLEHYGRKNAVNTCIDAFDYYAKNLPDYKPAKIHENIWVDMAVQANYQLGYHDFLYGKNNAVHHVKGVEAIALMLKFFFARFGVK